MDLFTVKLEDVIDPLVLSSKQFMANSKHRYVYKVKVKSGKKERFIIRTS